MKAWTITKKDLTVFFRDRAGMLLGFALPIALATIFGAAMGAMGGGGSSMGRATLYLEDRDGSEASRKLADALRDSKGLRLREIDLASEDEADDTAREHVAVGNGPAGLLIPEGYGAAIDAGEIPPLKLFRDPGKLVEQQIIAGNLMPVLFEASGEALGHRAMMKSLDWIDFPAAGRGEAESILEQSWSSMSALVARIETDEPEESADPAAETESPSEGGADEPADEDSGSGSFDFSSLLTDALGLEVENVLGGDDAAEATKTAAQAHAVAGIAVMMLLFGLVACGGTILEEEAGGTLERLRLAPGGARALLGGKFLFTFLIGLMQLVVLFLYGLLIFDLPLLRAPFALFFHSGCVAAAATGFGILFGVICRSRKQLEGLSTLVILVMSALGGSWFPLSQTPEWYQSLGHLTLTAWAMDGYHAIFWYEQGLTDILPEMGILLGIAAATSATAWMLWSKRVRA